MKRRLTTIICIILVLSLSVVMLTACGTAKVDKTDFEDAKLSGVGASIMAEVAYIEENYADRTYGTENEFAFVKYLDSKLSALGYQNHNQTFTYNNTLNTEHNEELTSTNVVFKKDNDKTDKAVLITSQIDNTFATKGFGSHNTYAGATGVAIMLELAKALKDTVLPYDVYFVGFGANQLSFEGAEKFFNEFYGRERMSDTLLMIDLSKPIGGDHMYMYTEEADTVHGKYLDDIAKSKSFDFKSVPRDKKIMNVTLLEDQPVNYTHVGMLSSNIFFYTERIPMVNFISLNWEANTFGDAVEREGNSNIENTERDRLDNLIELVGEEQLEKEADMVYTTILTALNDNAFVNTMEESAANMPNYKGWSNATIMIVVRLVFAVVIIVVAVLVSSRLKRDLPARPIEEFMRDMGYNPNNTGGNPFGGNESGASNGNDFDPFGESGDNSGNSSNNGNESNGNTNNNKDDSDDIFGI